jgi:hypothetical protein
MRGSAGVKRRACWARWMGKKSLPSGSETRVLLDDGDAQHQAGADEKTSQASGFGATHDGSDGADRDRTQQHIEAEASTPHWKDESVNPFERDCQMLWRGPETAPSDRDESEFPVFPAITRFSRVWSDGGHYRLNILTRMNLRDYPSP